MPKTKHSIRLPEGLWDSIPSDNKTEYIANAIQMAIQMGGQEPPISHTQAQPIIDNLQAQIEDLKKDKDYFKYLALPFWKRWKIKRLMPPGE